MKPLLDFIKEQGKTSTNYIWIGSKLEDLQELEKRLKAFEDKLIEQRNKLECIIKVRANNG